MIAQKRCKRCNTLLFSNRVLDKSYDEFEQILSADFYFECICGHKFIITKSQVIPKEKALQIII